MYRHFKKALTVAGSDSGGGAGIQADLKTFSANGVYGMTAITAITAQNTKGVEEIHPVPSSIIEKQISAVIEDIGTDALKIGMLHNCETIKTVVAMVKKYKLKNIVVDPVMTAASGDKLLRDEAISTLTQKLLPAATVITPNIFEAEIILDRKIQSKEEFIKAAVELSTTGASAILLKSGHFDENKDLSDILFIPETNEYTEISNKRINTTNTHGTGCTLSSAIAACLAHGDTIVKAVKTAIEYTHRAIEKGAGYKTGRGSGPVHHFHKFWD